MKDGKKELPLVQKLLIKNIKFYRKVFRFSQSDLGRKTGVSISYIGEIEIGRKFPSSKVLDKLAGAFNVDPYQLFVDREKDPYVHSTGIELIAEIETAFSRKMDEIRKAFL